MGVLLRGRDAERGGVREGGGGWEDGRMEGWKDGMGAMRGPDLSVQSRKMDTTSPDTTATTAASSSTADMTSSHGPSKLLFACMVRPPTRIRRHEDQASLVQEKGLGLWGCSQPLPSGGNTSSTLHPSTLS